MTGSRPSRLKELFARAVDLDGHARRALLDQECADDPALRQQLQALLAADDGPVAAALEDSANAIAGALPRPGDVIAGRYRILAQVGEGGMGVVFAAEQLEPRRRVALKCIRPGFASPESLARFRREAALLGRLQHPGIVPVFEAGIAEGSPPLPFLAMEFVDGRPLGEAARDLPLRARLELIVQVAEAVAHAHERGVVHRDLKPANVLVEHGSAGARARVLDFGVARLVDDVAGTLHTRTHQLVGTLAYLSPEQVERGSAGADARSDVWSLGIAMFELLAGRLPLPLVSCTLAEAARVLRDDEPLRLDRLVPALRGDVATIVHKALAKDPARRYPDAAALAADLRRYLADQPIAARPASALYRTTRFARRHRGLVVGLSVAFAALTVGLCVALSFGFRAATARDRAQARSDELRGLVRAVVQDVDRELETIAGATTARRLLLQTGLRYADGLALDAGDDAGLLLEVAANYVALAGIQGVPGGANLGDVDGALRTLQRAEGLVDRAERIVGQTLSVLQARLSLLAARESTLRALQRTDERLLAVDAIERVAQAVVAAVGTGHAAAAATSARAAAVRARQLADGGEFVAALAKYDDAVRGIEQGLGSAAGVDDRRQLAALQVQRALLLQRRGDLAGARAALTAAVAVREQLAAAEPGLPTSQDLASALRDLATHLVQYERDAKGALLLLLRARGLLAEPAAQEPQNVALQRLFLIVEFGIGDALAKLRRNDEALPVLERYVAAIDELAARPGQAASRRDGISGRQLLGLVHGRMGDRAAAEQALDQALLLARQEVARLPDGPLALDDLALTLGTYGAVMEGYAGDPQQSPEVQAECLRRAIDLLVEQEQVLGSMLERGLLAAPKRAILESLPTRIAALRARLG